MSTTQFLSTTQVDFKNLRPNAKITTLSNGGKCLWVKYCYPNHNQEALRIATPDVFLPFGLSPYKPKNAPASASYRWSTDPSFWKMEENELLKNVYDLACNLDDYALKLADEQSETWFGSKKTKEVLEDKLQRLVRESNPPGKYAPTMKIHANPNQKGEFQFIVCTPDGKIIPCNPNNVEEAKQVIPKQSRVRMLLEFSNIWFGTAGFGWSCRLKQIIVYPQTRMITTPLVGFVNEAKVVDEDVKMLISPA